MSLTQLSEEFVCSKQAVLRLISQLEASPFGKLIREKQGRESFYSIARPERLPQITLSPEGLSHLALCRDFLLHLLPSSVQSTIGETLQQASAYAVVDKTSATVDRAVPILAPMGKSFTKGCIDYTPFQDSIQIIIKAIYQQKVCIMHYKSSLRSEMKTFEIAPVMLVTHRDALYVRGWLVTEKGTPTPRYDTATNFAVHRIQEMIPTRRSSAHLPPVDDEQGAFGFMNFDDDETFSAEIIFAPSAATYVAERRWCEEQTMLIHEDGSLTLTMEANNSMELKSWVLSFGASARIVSPVWLVEEMQDELSKLAALYPKNP